MKLKDNLILFVSAFPGEFSFNWTKQTAVELSKITTVLFYYPNEKPVSLIKLILSRKERLSFTKRVFGMSGNLMCWVPITFVPFQRFSWSVQINRLFYKWQIKGWVWWLLTRYHKKQVVVWYTNPFSTLDLAERLFSVYDCSDNFPAVEEEKNREWAYIQELAFVETVDLVMVNSPVLLKKFQKAKVPKQKLFLVTAGWDIHQFLEHDSGKIPLDLEKPKVGFIGSITNRIDFILLEKIASQNPQWAFVMVGDVLPEKQLNQLIPSIGQFTQGVRLKMKKLTQLSNFFWIKGVEYETLPAYVKQFDVCIIPYDVKVAFNEMCNPIKLYAYMALGKPIVSTGIAMSKHYSRLLKVADTVEDFSTEIRRSLKNGLSVDSQRTMIKVARENNVTGRMKSIERAFRTL